MDLKKKPPKTGRTVRFCPLGRCTIFEVGAIVIAQGRVSSRRKIGAVRLYDFRDCRTGAELQVIYTRAALLLLSVNVVV